MVVSGARWLIVTDEHADVDTLRRPDTVEIRILRLGPQLEPVPTTGDRFDTVVLTGRAAEAPHVARLRSWAGSWSADGSVHVDAGCCGNDDVDPVDLLRSLLPHDLVTRDDETIVIRPSRLRRIMRRVRSTPRRGD